MVHKTGAMVNCKICGSKSFSTMYKGTIRTGRHGTWSDKEHMVYQCDFCKSGYLPGLAMDYESAEYREAVDGSNLISCYYKSHDNEQIRNLEVIPIASLRDKIIADVGCGGGSFLDLVKGYASQTIAVEPNNEFRQHLIKNGHKVFNYCNECLSSYHGKVDWIVSFAVIEHVENPVGFMQEFRKLIKPGGKVIISTPNTDDWLIRFLPGVYDRFFYRQAHRWYFNSESLSHLAEISGFSSVQFYYKQRFDISNALHWIRDGKPTGLGTIPIFQQIDDTYTANVENQGISDYLYAECTVS